MAEGARGPERDGARRWRPPLALVLSGALGGTLVIALAGLVVFRYLGPAIGFRQAAIMLGAVIALGTGVLGWLLWRLLMRPISAVQAYAARVRRDPLSAPAAPGHFGTRETHATAVSVMDMAATLQDRERSLRSYSDHVTHEIKTPVSAIRAAVELLEDGGGLGRGDRALVDQIAGAGAQIEAQLDALRRAAHAREARYLGQSGLREALALLAPSGLQVERVEDGALVPMAPEGLSILLGHLMGNAAAHGARKLLLQLRSDGPGCLLVVEDDGPGISPGNRPHVFDPFFTTRRDQDGTGMGLAIVRAMAEAHGGRIALGARADTGGARFELRFG